MKKPLLFVLIFLISQFCTTHLSAEEKSLSPAALKLVKQYELLKSDPTNINMQLAYLKTFPQNKKAFTDLFDQDDFSELYRSCEQYISLLAELSGKYQREVGLLLISITRDGAPGCCDSWSVLHHVTTDFAVKHTKLFASLLHALTEVRKRNVIGFMADKENHYGFKEYQLIIDNLKKLKENTLAKQFESARTRRMSVKDH